MLLLPELDDRSVQLLLKQAREMIPKLQPEWTDHNDHDPGITLLEMLAWMTELQEYRLNRITAENELKFLKLLNVLPVEAQRAITDITFEEIVETQIIPRGTPVAAGNLPFETLETVSIIPARLKKIIGMDAGDLFDYTSFNTTNRTNYPAFGKEVKPGNSLYLGFERELPLECEICLKINLYEDYPVPLTPLTGTGMNFIPSGKVLWEYCAVNDDHLNNLNQWTPLEIIKDETFQMSFSGRLIVKVPSRMRAARINELSTLELFWISGRVIEAGYEIPPRIQEITLNTVPAVHGNTFSETVIFSGTGGAHQSLEFQGYLPYYGLVEVQIRGDDGKFRTWSEMKDWSTVNAQGECYRLDKDPRLQKVVISFGNGVHGQIPPLGVSNIQVICYHADFEEKRMIGVSNLLPHQTFMLNWIKPGLPIFLETFKLQVGNKMPGGKVYLWENWEWVGDFDLSQSADCHFRFDELTNEISFGNNERGAIPGRASDNVIRIIACQIGGGENGNIKEGQIDSMAGLTSRPGKVTNRFPAKGGRNRESIEDAKHNVAKELKKQGCAVTIQDCEAIVKETPGLRVARVKAIPLFLKGLKDYPVNRAPAQITVVAVPYSESKKPVPSKGFLETIRLHLDPFRLITTEVHVIAPDYVKIKVHAVVVVTAHIVFGPEKVISVLNRFLTPIGNGPDAPVWPFGGMVRKGDLMSEITKIDGVEWVKEFWLEAEGEGIRREPSGDIVIPPYSLVYSDDADPHQIEITSIEEG